MGYVIKLTSNNSMWIHGFATMWLVRKFYPQINISQQKRESKWDLRQYHSTLRRFTVDKTTVLFYLQRYEVPTEQQIWVEEGDYVGIHYDVTGGRGIIPYKTLRNSRSRLRSLPGFSRYVTQHHGHSVIQGSVWYKVQIEGNTGEHYDEHLFRKPALLPILGKHLLSYHPTYPPTHFPACLASYNSICCLSSCPASCLFVIYLSVTDMVGIC